MKKARKYYSIVLVAFLAFPGCHNKKTTPPWELGIQTFTFNKFTLIETLDKTKQLGLHYVEACFFQEMGEGFPDSMYLNFDLSQESKDLLKKELTKRDIKLYASGVAFYHNEADWRRFFEFGSEFGFKVVTAEPRLDELDMVENLAKEYNIAVAIHNHSQPSVYANPDVLAKALEGRCDLIGVCADIGHWKHAGADPLQTIKRFKGKLKVIHFKDLNTDLIDTVWGTGILPLEEIMEELVRQNFDGLISIEYENFGNTQMEDVTNSLSYFTSLTKK